MWQTKDQRDLDVLGSGSAPKSTARVRVGAWLEFWEGRERAQQGHPASLRRGGLVPRLQEPTRTPFSLPASAGAPQPTPSSLQHRPSVCENEHTGSTLPRHSCGLSSGCYCQPGPSCFDHAHQSSRPRPSGYFRPGGGGASPPAGLSAPPPSTASAGANQPCTLAGLQLRSASFWATPT